MDNASRLDVEAFEVALLRSETLRIRCMLGAFALVLTIGIFRTVVPLSESPLAGPLIMGITLIYVVAELVLLQRLASNTANSGLIRGTAWRTQAVAECLFPTIGLALIITLTPVDPFVLLGSVGYGFIIVIIALSVLRMDPKGAALTGSAGTVGYALLVIYVFTATEAHTDYPFVYLNLTLMLAIATAAITLVTARVRGYVLIAVSEGETRRQRDQLQRDLDLASEIQRSLLPETMPVLAGYTIAAMSRPADQAGGDYYDWQAIDGNRVVLSLADVTGHGIGPALVTAACRAYLRACVGGSVAVATVIERVNKLLFDDMQAGRFVTVALLELDPDNHSAVYLSAGHAPTLHVHGKTDAIGTIDAQGVPLGLMEDSIIDEAITLELAPGDVLVLFTDGFYEWANADGEQFGLKRLQQVVSEQRQQSAQIILERVDDAVRAFVGNSRQADDMTAIIVKRGA